MELRRQIVDVAGNALGSELSGGFFNFVGVLENLVDQINFSGRCHKIKIRRGGKFETDFLSLPENAADSGVGVLNVVDGIFAGLFFRQIQIEVELAVD